MIPDGWLPPLRNTEDIPIQRDSVGAMGMNYPQPAFKAYVYRGTGEDQFPDWTLDPPAPRKRRVHDPAKIRATNIKRHKKYPPKGRRRRKHKPREEYVSWCRPVQEVLPDISTWGQSEQEPDPVPPTIPTDPSLLRRVRPSRDWKPTTGADLEDLWAELEDE